MRYPKLPRGLVAGALLTACSVLASDSVRVPLSLRAGWNFFSLPRPPLLSPDQLLPVSGTLWTFDNGRFLPAATIEPGRGYAVYLQQPVTVMVDMRRQTAVHEGPQALGAGWQLVGVFGPTGLPRQRRGSAWRYEQRYAAAAEMIPGQAYWIFLPEAAAIDLGSSLADIDGDGAPDFWESLWGLPPSTADGEGDADSDGLGNREEFGADTDPNLNDTDGDGFSDGFELLFGADPRDVLSVPASGIGIKLINDTGRDPGDRITSDPRLYAIVDAGAGIAALTAGFGETPVQDYVDILDELTPQRELLFDAELLATIAGAPLNDGEQTLHLLVSRQSAREVEQRSFTFVLDTMAPVAAVPDLPAAADSGPFNDDNITNVSAPPIQLTAAAGDELLVRVNGAERYRGLSAGTEELVLSLSDGVHRITCQLTDPAGNIGTISAPLDLTIAGTTPTTALVCANDGMVGQPAPHLVVGYSAPMSPAAADGASYTLRDGSGELVPFTLEALTAATVRLLFPTPLADGNYELTFADGMSDLAGNPLPGPIASPFVVDRLFALVSTSPAAGTTMVNPRQPISLTFDAPAAAATVAPALTVLAGGRPISGSVAVSASGQVATFYPTVPLPAAAEVRLIIDGEQLLSLTGKPLDADGDHTGGGVGEVAFRTITMTQRSATVLFGYVRDAYTGEPVVGATMRIDGFPEDTFAPGNVTDAAGRFELRDVPAPEFFAHIDGSTATNAPPGMVYPTVGKRLHSVEGETVQLAMDGTVFDIYLPPMAIADRQPLAADAETAVGFGDGAMAALAALFPDTDATTWDLMQVNLPAGAAVDASGTPATTMALVPVPPDRIPAPLPPGVDVNLVISIQAPGATRFDVPAPVTFPNIEGLAPGSSTFIASFNHDVGEWQRVATATVSDDGLRIVSDPGTGVRAPGWHLPCPCTGPIPPFPGPCVTCGDAPMNEDAFIVAGTSGALRIDFYDDGIKAGEDWTYNLKPAFSEMRSPQIARVVLPPYLLLPSAVLEGNFRIIFTPLTYPNEYLAQTMVTRFADASQADYIHSVGSELSDLVKTESGTFQRMRDEAIAAIRRQLLVQVESGFIDNRLLNLSGISPPAFGLPQFEYYHRVLGPDPLPVKAMIGGTQASGLRMANFRASADAASRQGQYSFDLFFDILDDFGLDYGDIYAPGLIDFFVLQHHREGYRPFMNAIVVKEEVTGTFTIPEGFDSIEDRSTSPARELAVARDHVPISTVSGFGSDPTIYVRYHFDTGVSMRTKYVPGGPHPTMFFPQGSYFSMTCYQPASNRSLRLLKFSAPPGSGTGFGNWPTSSFGGGGPAPTLDTFGGEDRDGDGVPDDGEYAIGMNPDSPDSDSDGIPDAVELIQGLDPLDGQAPPVGVLGTAAFSSDAVDLAAGGEMLVYVATLDELVVVDVSDASNPIQLAALPLPGAGRAVAVADDGLSLAVATAAGLLVVDVSDPGTPTVRAVVGTAADTVVAVGNMAYAAIDSAIVSVDLISGIMQQSLPLAFIGAVTGLDVAAGVLYAMQGAFGQITTVAVADGQLQLLGGTTTYLSSRLQVAGDTLFVLSNGISYFDVSNPAAPVYIGAAAGGITSVDLGLTGFGRLLVASLTTGVGVLDVSDLSDPDNALYQLAMPGEVHAVVIESGLAYAAAGSAGLHVVNFVDGSGGPPTVQFAISTDLSDIDDQQSGIQVHAGGVVPLTITADGDIAIRQFEFLVNGQAVATDTAYPWQLPAVTLSDRANVPVTISARVTDRVGNVLTTPNLTLESVRPSLVLALPPANATVTSLAELRYVFSEAMAASVTAAGGVTLTGPSGPVALGPLTLQADDRVLVVPLPQLAPGAYQVRLRAAGLTDSGGNALGSDLELPLTVAPQPPSASLFDYPALLFGGASLDSFVVADFDGDDRSDLAAITSAGVQQEVSIWLNDHVAGLTRAATLPLLQGSGLLTAADIDGDGDTDLLTTLQMLLADGAGNFAAPIALPTAMWTRPVIADVTGDGVNDLLGTRFDGFNASSIIVHPGTGAGTFAAAVVSDPGVGSAGGLLVADLNGDTRPDLLYAHTRFGNPTTYTVAKAFGNGDGTFTVQPIVTAALADALALADLDGNSTPDLVASLAPDAFSSAALTYFLNDGNGSFRAPVTFGPGGQFLIADWDGDQRPDAMALPGDSGGSVTVYPGNGSGFADGIVSSSGVLPGLAAAAAGNLIADADLDLALDLATPPGILVVPGAGDGSLSLPSSDLASPDFDLEDVVLADFDGDGQLDLVARMGSYSQGPDLVWASGNGDGSFGPLLALAHSGLVADAIAADFDGDQQLDIVVALRSVPSAPAAGDVAVYRSNGDGSFEPASYYSHSQGREVARLFWLDDALVVLSYVDAPSSLPKVERMTVSAGILTPQDTSSVAVPEFAADYLVADLGGSQGLQALALFDGFDAQVVVSTHDAPRADSFTVTETSRAVLVDVNNDGALDFVGAGILAAFQDNRLVVSVKFNDGSGNLLPFRDDYAIFADSFSVAPAVRDVAVGDLAGDANVDIVVLLSNGMAAVLIGNGAGQFGSATHYVLGETPFAAALGDLDRDGDLDLVAAVKRGLLGAGGSIAVRLNRVQ